MDLIIAAAIALLLAIITALTALVRKKPKKKILLYGLAGLILGLLPGYALAPFIISFL